MNFRNIDPAPPRRQNDPEKIDPIREDPEMNDPTRIQPKKEPDPKETPQPPTTPATPNIPPEEPGKAQPVITPGRSL